MSSTTVRQIRLDHLISVFIPGSHGPEWTWNDEYEELYSREWQQQLTDQIKTEGIREPILLGSDGRVWDGHHRICAAMKLGLDTVPVEFAAQTPHDAQSEFTELKDELHIQLEADRRYPETRLAPENEQRANDFIDGAKWALTTAAPIIREDERRRIKELLAGNRRSIPADRMIDLQVQGVIDGLARAISLIEMSGR